DDPAARFIPDRPPTTAIGSESSFDLARKWLHECHENHKECPKSVGILPSRVLDIGARFPIRSVKLHWTEEGESGRYAALSYCWGGLQPISSTQHTAQDFTDGILFSKFPQTLQDAMITTFKLGIRYLWIDCLCIIQDDPEDMAREIAKMAQIFEEAYVTISASSARNVNEGFLSPREPPVDSRLKLPYQTDDDGEMGSIIIEQPRQYSPEQTPISLRAWTLQEHILSPRILDYSVQELWWVCRSATLYNGSSEAQATPLSTNTQFPRAGMASLESWRSIVRDYTRRFLTYPSDKLPAISGVAAEYDKIFDGTYLAGLWQFALVSELMWSSNRSDITRPALQRAPSWSWASVDGEI
ncbi:HET-domain-containing protein, partial [Zopfia rhizophila CBS 207.26]